MEQQPQSKPKKLRQACDNCHSAKMRCGGGNPCVACKDNGGNCTYSVSNRIGRPKGTKNKRTLERLSRQADNVKEQPCSIPISMPSHASSCLGSPISTTPTFTDDGSIDAMLGAGTNSAYNLSSSLQTEHYQVQYPEPLDAWCDLDGLAGMPNVADPTSPTKMSHAHRQSSLLNGDISFSPLLDTCSHFPSASSLSSSYGAPPYISPAASPSKSNDRGTDITIPTDLSRYNSAESGTSSVEICCCLEHHSELNARLKELEQNHIIPRIDVVLYSAQQALIPWKNVIGCQICRNDDNQEILLLSAMSIRSVLRHLQLLLIESRCQSPMGGALSPRNAFSSRPSPTIAGNPGLNEEIRSAIGIYEITGEERTAVTDLLISRTLDRVRYTLIRFKERVEGLKQRRAMTSNTSGRPSSSYRMGSIEDGENEDGPLGGSEDLEKLEQAWRDLDRTIQRLLRAIRSGTTTPLESVVWEGSK